MKALRFFQIAATLFVCIGAVVGAIMMWTDPTGQSFGMETMLDLLRMQYLPAGLS